MSPKHGEHGGSGEDTSLLDFDGTHATYKGPEGSGQVFASVGSLPEDESAYKSLGEVTRAIALLTPVAARYDSRDTSPESLAFNRKLRAAKKAEQRLYAAEREKGASLVREDRAAAAARSPQRENPRQQRERKMAALEAELNALPYNAENKEERARIAAELRQLKADHESRR